MVKGSSQISSGYKVEDTQILYSTNKVCDQFSDSNPYSAVDL